MIVCIPSLGRTETKTYKLFEDGGADVFHFLEPQEMDLYDVPNKINIGDSGKGISFVRNFINEWARAKGHDFIIVCDDDVDHFGDVENKKSVKKPDISSLTRPWELFKKSGCAVGGINQRQFAWSETKNYRVNKGKVQVLAMLNLKKITWEYRGFGKVDIDYLMQCIDSSNSFLFFPKVFTNSPKIGSNEGGLHEYYSSKNDGNAARILAKRWPMYTKVIEQYGRTDCRVDYGAFAKDKGLKVI